MRPGHALCGLLVAIVGAGLLGAQQPGLLAGDKSVSLPGDQPYASYWFPNQLLSWSPASDPDAAYNRSNTPLRDRFSSIASQANPHARVNEAKVSSLAIFAATSGNPSQGSLDINAYAFNYWQYLGVLVFWGGSAGEGLILAPNPGIIDAAHSNGVPVLGTIFFPPLAYGGDIQWVWDLVQTDGATFPVADKLIEVAEHYGFDGYFINQETAGGNATLATAMIDFMKYFQAHSSLELMWYDAMTESGSIAWQEQLNSLNDAFFTDGSELVSEHMFLDFGWSAADLQASRAHAQGLGRSEFDLHAGIDVQAAGYNTSVNWNAVFPEGSPHTTSLGMYVPSWTYSGAADPGDFYARANRLWVGANRDPGDTTTTANWKGLAHYVPAFSAVSDIPFVTNFCTGQGLDFYIDGDRLSHPTWSTHGWNNIALQDVLPTWRWLVESSGVELYPEIDFSDGYYGGNCLKVSGDSGADNHLKLYKTDLLIGAQTRLELAVKTATVGPSGMKAGLAFASDPASFTFLDIGDTTSSGWHTVSYDLSSFSGDSIVVISLFFPAGAGPGYAIKIGRIAVLDGAVGTGPTPTGLTVENKVNEAGFVTLRLRWDHVIGATSHYNVYRRNPDNSLTFLGGTPNNALFIPELLRVGDEAVVTVEVAAVGTDFGHSNHATIAFNWDPPPSPATNPSPADGASDVFRNPVLSWTPGNGIASHDVYFGTTDPPPFIGNQVATTFTPEFLPAEALHFWRIDEVNSQGTATGQVWSFSTGQDQVNPDGHALDFDGSDDHLDCGNAQSLRITGSAITLEALIKARSWRSNLWEGSILNKEHNGAGADRGYMLRAGNDGQLNFNLGTGTWNEISSGTGVMELNRWHHVAGTYDGATMRLYVDGQLVAEQAGSIVIADAATSGLYVGGSQNNPGRVFAGVIDEIRVWSVARTPAEIQAYQRRELEHQHYGPPASGLVGYWRCDSGAGQQAADLTSFANHAVLGSTSGSDENDPTWVSSDAVAITPLFEDGFESADTTAWSITIPAGKATPATGR